jgi:hypothetical protein
VPHRLLVPLTIAVALFAATTAGASTMRTPTVARGQTFHIRLTTESLADCAAVVNYRDAGLQFGTVKQATDSRLSWALPISRSRPLGRATWYVRCGLSIIRSGAFIVVSAPSAG